MDLLCLYTRAGLLRPSQRKKTRQAVVLLSGCPITHATLPVFALANSLLRLNGHRVPVLRMFAANVFISECVQRTLFKISWLETSERSP